MSIQVVDRRNNPKGKSSENRQRLLKRLENQIQKALPDIIKNTNVKDITGSGEQVKIPIKGVGEPQFSAVEQGVRALLHDLNAAKVLAGELAGKFVVVARDVQHMTTFAHPAQ